MFQYNLFIGIETGMSKVFCFVVQQNIFLVPMDHFLKDKLGLMIVLLQSRLLLKKNFYRHKAPAYFPFVYHKSKHIFHVPNI